MNLVPPVVAIGDIRARHAHAVAALGQRKLLHESRTGGTIRLKGWLVIAAGAEW